MEALQHSVFLQGTVGPRFRKYDTYPFTLATCNGLQGAVAKYSSNLY